MTTSNLNNRIDKDINEQGIHSTRKSEKYNKVTIAAIEEGRKIAKDPTAIGFWSVEKLKKELQYEPQSKALGVQIVNKVRLVFFQIQFAYKSCNRKVVLLCTITIFVKYIIKLIEQFICSSFYF